MGKNTYFCEITTVFLRNVPLAYNNTKSSIYSVITNKKETQRSLLKNVIAGSDVRKIAN